MLLSARRVWVGLWLTAAALSLVALAFALQGDLSVIRLWRHIQDGRIGNESWLLLQHAIALRPANGADLYQVVYFEHGIKLSYPPSALLLWQAATAACPSCSAEALFAHLNRIGWLVTPAIPAVMSALLLSASWARQASGRDRMLLVGGVVAVCAAYYPLVLANTLGQVQAWLNSLFAIAFWGFCRNRHVLAGVAIGLMVLVKPYAGLLVLWAILRRHRRLAVAALCTVAAGTAVAMAMFGVDSHLGYFRMASVVSERGESLYANQSFNGLLNRLFLEAPQIRWEHTAPPPYHPAVAMGTIAGLVGGTALALVWPARTPSAGAWSDLAFVSVMMLIASPIGWEHYYPLLLPLFAMFLASAPAQASRMEIVLLVASTLLTGVFVGPIARIESRQWSMLQSYQLAGAVVFLVALTHRMRRSGVGGHPSA